MRNSSQNLQRHADALGDKSTENSLWCRSECVNCFRVICCTPWPPEMFAHFQKGLQALQSKSISPLCYNVCSEGISWSMGRIAEVGSQACRKQGYAGFRGVDEPGKKRLVVLGSGWAAARLAREIDLSHVNLTVIFFPSSQFLPPTRCVAFGPTKWPHKCSSLP